MAFSVHGVLRGYSKRASVPATENGTEGIHSPPQWSEGYFKWKTSEQQPQTDIISTSLLRIQPALTAPLFFPQPPPEEFLDRKESAHFH